MSVASVDPTPTDSAPAGPPDSGSRVTTNARAGVAAFVGIAGLASALFLYLGRRVWFFNDEWDFITTRRAGSFDDLMRPHFGHWSTIPILVYRFLWWTVGLRSYVPYQVLIIALHVGAAWLVRVVMRRAGVRPWIATTTAAILLLFGRGYQDIVWAFQITQVGSLVFGLTHLLLVDHDGPLDRRDWFGLAAGTVGMLCSGVAVTMVIVVGIAALVRRGWRIAAVHTVPLGVVYLVWWYAYARGSYSTQGITPFALAKFVAGTIANVVRAAGSYDVVAALLGALLIAGLALAWRPLTRVEWSKQASATFALLVGAVVYLVITAFGRAGLPGATHRSRYLDLTLAMLLPSVGIAADAVVRRWGRTASVAVLAVLVIGMPGNVRAIAAYTNNQEKKTAEFRRTVFVLPQLAASRLVPASTEPLAPFTIRWLLDGAASGRIPKPPEITTSERAEDRLRLVLRKGGAHTVGSACRPVTAGVRISLGPGDSVRIAGSPVTVAPYAGTHTGYLPLSFDAGVTLSSALGTVHFRVFPEQSHGRSRVCGAPRVFRVR